MHPLGQTRTSIQPNHAFIAPDGHVPAALPGWTQSQAIHLITPRMNNRPQFNMYLAMMAAGGQSAMPPRGVQRFIYVKSGTVTLSLMNPMTFRMEAAEPLQAGRFAYIPAAVRHTITSEQPASLIVFEKQYASLTDSLLPEAVIGNAWDGAGEPFMGDDDARLRVLLPTDDRFDMAVNLFTFQPGAALPFVETHIMEHGLYLLEGQGIYRLDDRWYPIQANDVLWMGAYCPQWFAAHGKTASTYLYYKDVNRDPLA